MCHRFIPFTGAQLQDAAQHIRSQGDGGGCVALARLLDEQFAASVATQGAQGAQDIQNIQGVQNTQAAEARPGSLVALLVVANAHLMVTNMTWGFVAPWQPSKLVFNTRIENALTATDGQQRRGMWDDSLEHRRCVIPVRGFYETHRSQTVPSSRTGKPIKAQVRFDLLSNAINNTDKETTSPAAPHTFFLAGIYQDDRFSVMTTSANACVAPVHDRMPVALLPAEASSWLGPHYMRLADRSNLQLDTSPANLGIEDTCVI